MIAIKLDPLLASYYYIFTCCCMLFQSLTSHDNDIALKSHYEQVIIVITQVQGNTKDKHK